MSKFVASAMVAAVAAPAMTTHVPMGAMFRRGFHFDPEGTGAPAATATAAAGSEKPKAKTSEQLRAEFATLAREADALMDAAEAAGSQTEEQRTANDARFARMTAIKALLDERTRFAGLALAGGRVTVAAEPAGRTDYEASTGNGTPEPEKIDKAEFGKALAAWAASGTMDRKFATITTATSSGALYPKQVAGPVVVFQGSALREAMAAAGASPVVTDSTAEMNIPVIAVAVGSDISETATSGTDNSPTPPVINLKPTPMQSGQVWVGNLELRSLDYDLTAEVVPGLRDAKEMRLEQKAIAAMIADAGITQVVTAASTSTLTYDNLVDLNQIFSRRYDRQKVILLSDQAYVYAGKLKDTTGQPILNRDPQNQTLQRFNGTPVIRCSYLEAFGTGKFIGAAISFVGFRVRDCGSDRLIRHVDDKDKIEQTGLNLVGYHAFGYVPAAVAFLKT